jgi:hypothetical protein
VRAESRLSWLAVAAGSALCAAASAVGADARWLAALGSTIARAGHIPSSIPYAAAPSHDWVNVPVLGELVFHWLESVGGDRGLIAAQAVAVAATLTLLLRDMRSADASDGARALVIVALPFAALSALLVVRAQLFSLPLFALAILLLRAEARRPSWRIWLLVPLVALWSNLHGAVLTGLVVATVYLVVDRFRRDRWTTLGVLAATWGALFATPALARTGEYYLGVLHSEPAVSGFGMWAPLSLRNPLDVVFLAVAVPLFWFAVRARPKTWELVSLALLALATVHVGRNSVWLMLFVAVPAACGMRFRNSAPSKGVVLACAWLVPVVLLVAAISRAPAQTVAGPALRDEAVRLAGAQPILADAEDAEQLALDGSRVWIANPIDAFARDDQRAYLSWLQGQSAGDAVLLRHDVVLVQVDSKAQARLAGNAAFREIRRDAVAVLYRRVS